MEQTLDEWTAIEREARHQVRAELIAEDAVRLTLGAAIAWRECRFGKTNDLSLVHRVGESIGDATMSLCGELIPAPLLRLPLTPNFIHALGRCRYCEDAYTKRGAAA